MYRILVINPGSTSTKVALYEDEKECWNEGISHDEAEIAKYPTIFSQLDMRYRTIEELFRKKGVSFQSLDCVVARGGLLPPVSSGAIRVNQAMLETLIFHPMNHHASNLGAALAYQIAEPLGLPCYIYDPVTVDEMLEVMRITGLKEVKRFGQGHNLNMRAAALKFCQMRGMDYRHCNLLIAHLGGGITLSLHSDGRIIDMVSDDDGPFSPERAGEIPTYKLVNLIFDRNLSRKETMNLLQHNGGLKAHLGTTDAHAAEVAARNGDKNAELVLDALALNVARCIAKLAVAVNGKVDAILLTGGIAYSEYITGKIRDRVSFIAETVVLPGENEMQALANGAMRVLAGVETAAEYHKEDMPCSL